ncbi:MAG: tetratricopeptide repeat protein [Rhodospirillales bacterium]|nr:tetratricopeptide repeat protein [Rhodospirillales bacterium]
MNPRVVRRFIVLMALLTVGGFIFWDVLDDFVKRAPGDFETEMGSNRLVDEQYDEAMDYFDKALLEAPDHRGALMGRALVFIRTERYDEAIAELDYLIDFLNRNLTEVDDTGRGVLAAAHANRGIVHDRQERYEEALADYIQALNTDNETVGGPGVIDKILYGSEGVSSVRDRAIYIHEQLQLPEGERLMRVPELDAKQRMYKP